VPIVMENLDAATVGKNAVRLGLLTEEQLLDAREEAGATNPDPAELMRVLERRSILTPLQTFKLLRGDEDGYFLGGYRMLYKIASGSFGRVFRADDPRSGRIVAVKVLRHRWSENTQQIELFLREGRVGMTLQHPNIVQVLAVNQDPVSQQFYMVMEFVEGGNLREILKIRQRLSPTETLRIIEEAASALAYAFTRGVTHRDIKPSNLLMSSQGSVKLVDFGLARLFQTARPEEEAGEKVDRTVDYAGLEKATGVKPGDVRSDIYFLGCVAYQLLTGRSPLELTRSRSARMNRARFDNVVPLRSANPEIPANVAALVESMMSLDPNLRHQTPAQLLDAVRSVRVEGELGVSGSSAERPAFSGETTTAARTLFIVERNARLQEALRNGFKKLGFRVFLANDPERARERFRQQPFDALIVDGATAGESAIATFGELVAEARRRRLSLAAILVVGDDQAEAAARLQNGDGVAILERPVTLRQLHDRLRQLLPAEPE
jgi:CheY-like chemotaxis protein/predicted Ser/Thr protein kinase